MEVQHELLYFYNKYVEIYLKDVHTFDVFSKIGNCDIATKTAVMVIGLTPYGERI